MYDIIKFGKIYKGNNGYFVPLKILKGRNGRVQLEYLSIHDFKPISEHKFRCWITSKEDLLNTFSVEFKLIT